MSPTSTTNANGIIEHAERKRDHAGPTAPDGNAHRSDGGRAPDGNAHRSDGGRAPDGNAHRSDDGRAGGARTATRIATTTGEPTAQDGNAKRSDDGSGLRSE